MSFYRGLDDNIISYTIICVWQKNETIFTTQTFVFVATLARNKIAITASIAFTFRLDVVLSENTFALEITTGHVTVDTGIAFSVFQASFALIVTFFTHTFAIFIKSTFA